MGSTGGAMANSGKRLSYDFFQSKRPGDWQAAVGQLLAERVGGQEPQFGGLAVGQVQLEGVDVIVVPA
jgi:hypothetical protein